MTKHRIIRNPSGYHSFGNTHKEKVFNFAKYIKDFDWTGSWSEDEDSKILKLVATRGDNERIDIEWPESQWWPDVWYTYAGNSQKCRNISAAAKLAQELPDADKMRRAARKRRPRKAGASRLHRAEAGAIGLPGEPPTGLNGSEYAEELVTSLPFDKESSIEEVVAALKQHRNPTIVWVNRISGNVDSAMMRTGKRHNKVMTNKEGKVIVQFTDERGFHAVYVESIVGLS